MKKITIKRITYWAMMLSILCVLGMFSINFGDNLKVSIQLFVVYLIGMISISFIDSFFITLCYVLLGLFMPIYAGFTSGITPTFGFVLGFIPGSIALTIIKNYFEKKESKKLQLFGLIFASIITTLIVYIFGTGFMYFYFLNIGSTKDLSSILWLCVIPYIPFDIIKIILSISIYLILNKSLKNLLNNI